MARHVTPAGHTSDRIVQGLQRGLESLQRQLSQSKNKPVLGLDAKAGKSFALGTGRHLYDHEVPSAAFKIVTTHDHYMWLCPCPMAITAAYWVPGDVFTADTTNYSWIRIEERRKADGYAVTGWRETAYISGQPQSAGAWATGDLVAGFPYRFELRNPNLQKESLIVMDTEAQTVPGVWPEGYVLISYRYLDDA